MNVNPKENILNTASGNTQIDKIPEFTTNSANKVVKITGILTSNLRTRTSSNTPYMAFFRPFRNCQKHPLEECERTKCKDCEIPVVFRIKEAGCICNHTCSVALSEPKLNKGNKVILTGKFCDSKKGSRPSFTCSAYQVLSHGK
jgi:hypothetical protein